MATAVNTPISSLLSLPGVISSSLLSSSFSVSSSSSTGTGTKEDVEEDILVLQGSRSDDDEGRRRDQIGYVDDHRQRGQKQGR